MKNLFLIVLFVGGMIHSTFGQTVYVTKTGKKYHKGSCHYLRTSKTAIDYSKAQQFYSACSICKPNSSGSTIKSSSRYKKTNSKSSIKDVKTTSKRCSAKTKSGARCKRNTKNSSGRCWQHD